MQRGFLNKQSDGIFGAGGASVSPQLLRAAAVAPAPFRVPQDLLRLAAAGPTTFRVPTRKMLEARLRAAAVAQMGKAASARTARTRSNTSCGSSSIWTCWVWRCT